MYNVYCIYACYTLKKARDLINRLFNLLPLVCGRLCAVT